MAVKWKKKFKPEIVIKRIDATRQISADGNVSFVGWGIEEFLPVVQTMLGFPAAADLVDKSTLVWRGLASVKGSLTATSLLESINAQLSKELSSREVEYHILTSVSIARVGLPRRMTIDNAVIFFQSKDYPGKYRSRKAAIENQRLPVKENDYGYCQVIIYVSAKSPRAAVNKALRSLDLLRSLWCLASNPQLQIVGQAWVPINVVRLGSVHTLHHNDGSVASDLVWFEPNYVQASIYARSDYSELASFVTRALNRIKRSKYGNAIIEALLRYVRAFDEPNQNVAFMGAWGAVESLVTPGVADYDGLVRRCAFLFQDVEYHVQVLEHLREYRNRSVHAGEDSEKAKTHCYQIQLYLRVLIGFHLNNTKEFESLDEANRFLDLPSDRYQLIKERKRIDKALKFINPLPNAANG